MSLTEQDLDQIRTVVVDAINESFEVLSAPRFDQLESQLAKHTVMLGEHSSTLLGQGRQLAKIETTVSNIDGRLQAIESDVKELYHMV